MHFFNTLIYIMTTNGLDKCKLCGEVKKLCNSHIIPEFFYEPLYDENHKIQRMNFNPDISVKRKYEQKGIREKLFCVDCETLLSKLEKYACDIWKNKLQNLREDFNYLQGIDYLHFKLFLISIIWRCGVTSDKSFTIKLGPHKERMRKMILENNPGNYNEYGCIISAMVYDNNELVEDIIQLETDFRLDGHRCYRLLFGGFIWVFYVSSHNLPKDVPKLFLQHSNSLIIPKLKLHNLEFMMKRASKFFEGNLDYRSH